jgi:hypothetical protein
MQQSKLIVGLVIIALGLGFLFDFHVPVFKIAIALLIIWIGIRVLTGMGGSVGSDVTDESAEESVRSVHIFSSLNKRVTADHFRGGEVVAIFGGGQIDLTNCTAAADKIDFSAVAIFGGLKIIVPAEWNVQSEGVGIFGGFNNRTAGRAKADSRFRVSGVAIFGGVDIINAA